MQREIFNGERPRRESYSIPSDYGKNRYNPATGRMQVCVPRQPREPFKAAQVATAQPLGVHGWETRQGS